MRGCCLLAGIALTAIVVTAQAPRPAVVAGELDVVARCRVLSELQDRGELDEAQLLRALRDQELQPTAVAILRHEWPEWSKALRQALLADEAAATAVLAELAIAPRPAVDDWVVRVAATAPSSVMQALALAARQRPPDRREGEVLLRAVAVDGLDAAAMAMRYLPSAVADQLVGAAHALLASGTPCERLGPWFDRLSMTGVRQLLGLVAAADAKVAEQLAAVVARRDDAAFRDRVRAAVDGEIPLELPWLLRAGPWADTPARRGRIGAVMTAASSSPALAVAAFDALLEGGVYLPALWQFAQQGERDRWRRFLAAGLRDLPEPVVLEALTAPPLHCVVVLEALGVAPLPLGVERAVTELARGATSLDPEQGRVVEAALQLLAQRGSDAAAMQALALARADEAQSLLLYDALARRRDPIGVAALFAEAARGPLGSERGDRLALAIAEAGDRRTIDELVAHAAARGPAFVRRCRHAIPELSVAQCQLLAASVPECSDLDTRLELLLWLAPSDDPAVRQLLRSSWMHAEDGAERETALAGLLAGAEREALVRQWQAALPVDPDRDDAFAFAAIATVAAPASQEDVELLQYLLFTAPRRDPREAVAGRECVDGRSGFPVVAAIADRLRREPDLARRVVAVAPDLALANDTRGLVRQRFLSLWTALQAEPTVRDEVAMATAALVLAMPDDAATGIGIAAYWQMRDLAARGRHAAAAAAARPALAHLLRLPAGALDARIHLGVRDVENGADPHAALAAMPHLCAGRAAASGGEVATARRHLQLAREFAGRDAATHAAITAILEDLR